MATDSPSNLQKTSRDSAVSASVLGLMCAAIGTLASYWVRSGKTPAIVYGVFGDLALLTSAELLWGVPVELLGLAGFAVSLWILLGSGKHEQLRRLALFLVAVLCVGIWLVDQWRRPLASVTGTIACLAALGVLVRSGRYALPSPRLAWNEVRSVASAVLASPRSRFAVLVTLCAATALVYGARRVVSGDLQQARQRNFVRWYESQERATAGTDRASKRIHVEFFTDYVNPKSAVLPFVQRVVQRVAANSPTPVHLTLRDFPEDSTCNPTLATSINAGTSACHAALAVRLVRDLRDEDTTREFLGWLLQSAKSLTPQAIETRVAELGLASEWGARREALRQRITEDVEIGRRLGVRSVPAIYVDGVPAPAAHLGAVLRSKAKRAVPAPADSPLRRPQ